MQIAHRTDWELTDARLDNGVLARELEVAQTGLEKERTERGFARRWRRSMGGDRASGIDNAVGEGS